MIEKLDKCTGVLRHARDNTVKEVLYFRKHYVEQHLGVRKIKKRKLDGMIVSVPDGGDEDNHHHLSLIDGDESRMVQYGKKCVCTVAIIK